MPQNTCLPPIVLVTGCSSGIGKSLMEILAVSGYTVVATALPSSFEQLAANPVAAQPNVHPRPLDIADFDAATALVQEIAANVGPISILVNNAGISYRSTVEDMTPADELRQITVNYLGPMHLIRACLPAMRERRAGRIVNISSVGGMMAMPTMASYSASKFALEGASEALWYELRPWNIHVTLVRPGFINSLAITKVMYSQTKRAGQSHPEYESHYRHMTEFIENITRRTPCTSEKVARKVADIIRRPKPPLRVAGTPDARLFYFVRRVLPRAWYHKLLYRSLPGVASWGPSKNSNY